MAKAKQQEEKTNKPKAVRRRKQVTVRERIKTSDDAKPRRIRSTAGRAVSPVRKLASLRPRRSKGIRIFGRRIRIIPPFISGAWSEIRQVTWPTWRDTVRLTFAVFIFAVLFAAFVGVLDFGLDKLFREVILK